MNNTVMRILLAIVQVSAPDKFYCVCVCVRACVRDLNIFC
jgi:hypothetical protein